MSELAASIPGQRPAGDLARALASQLRLSWEAAAYALFVVTGAGLRFWDLGSRALHHDESLHGYFSYQLFRNGVYEHSPLMHGPFQFFGNTLVFFLSGGASDYTVRILPALAGTALILLPLLFRDRLGPLGALAASALIAFSPTLLYYSRFARGDIYVAVFTLALVICVWRYIDERKPLYLYLAAAVLAFSFATKEVTFINIAVLLAFLNFWLAGDLHRQLSAKWNMRRPIRVAALALFLSLAWLVAALWPLLPGLRERLGLRDRHPAADLLVVLGTLAGPQLSAAFQRGIDMPTSRFGFNFNTELFPDRLQDMMVWFSDHLNLGDDAITAIETNQGAILLVPLLLLASALVGLRWNWRAWLIVAAAFYVPYVLLYTTFLTNPDGFASGISGSLDYWLDQHEVRRGDQPWFYYLMLLPAYEFLPLVFAAPAFFWFALKGDAFQRFLVFWVAATLLGYSWVGEKMPWLSVHTSLPVIILAAYTIGRWRLRPSGGRLALPPAVVPVAAAAVGAGAGAFAVFGPEGGRWVFARLGVGLLAVAFVLALLLPLGRQRLALVVAAVLAGALGMFSLRAGVIVAFEHGDVPDEPLIYTQTSPDVPDVMERIEEIARVSGRGRSLPIVVDSTYTWPWAWYLRDYTNATYIPIGPEFEAEPDAVLLVALDHEQYVKPFAGAYQEPQRYVLRWWFPEAYRGIQRDSLWDAGFDFIGSALPVALRIPDSTPRFLPFLPEKWEKPGAWDTWWHGLRDRDSWGVPDAWHTWWRFFRDRQPPAEKGHVDSLAYFPRQYVRGTAGEAPGGTAGDLEGRLIIGAPGAAEGQLADPVGVALDAQGNVYVADSANNRIQKFAPDGRFLSAVGGPGVEAGQFNQPGDLAVDAQGFVYVVDTWNHRIQKFDPALAFVAAWGQPTNDLINPAPDRMWGPRAIDIDADGNLWVVDTGTARIRRFAPDGTVLGVFGGRGKAPGQFQEPVGIAVGPVGDIYIADAGNARIQRLTRDFAPVISFPVDAWVNLDPANKPYLAVLPDGRMLTTDSTTNSILLLDAEGRLVTSLPAVRGTPLLVPRGVAFQPAGSFIFLAEGAAGHVRRFPLSDFALR